MQPYQWLLFDADGTLLDYEKAEAVALAEALGAIKTDCDPSILATYKRINSALWLAVERGELAPAAVKVRRFEQFFDAAGITHSPAAFSAIYLECLASCSHTIPGAAEVLDVLGRKYQMAILTNGLQIVARGRIARSPFCRHISEIIISEEIGFSKPAREYFDIALARLGNPSRRDVLMIGDGWASDVRGAVQSGINVCWYNPERKPRPDDSAITREIASLRELVDWLG